MARKPNYGFEKRRKEIEKQRKKAEKLARKRGEEPPPADGEGVRPPSDLPPPRTE